MNETRDTDAVPVEGGRGPGELQAALGEFVSGLKRLRGEIETKMDKQEKTMSMIQAKAARRVRPAPSVEETGAPHRAAFDAYVRSGEDDALRGLELEGKAITTGSDTAGFIVDPQTSATVQGVLQASGSIRQIATVVNVEATSYDVLVDHGDFGSGWASETSIAGLPEDAKKIERVKIPLHELSALPKISQRLLDDAAFDVEGWLARRIADTFAAHETRAFVDGDGEDKPKGFLQETIVADENADGWGELGFVKSGKAGGFKDADALIDLVYALGARYRINATFVMNSKTAGTVRKLKDGDGRFLWIDGLGAGEPARLLGYPVLIVEAMPDVAGGHNAIAFGDFAAGYTVAERPDLRILRDPFSAKPHVLFYATKRVGGGVTDFRAIKLLKFSA